MNSHASALGFVLAALTAATLARPVSAQEPSGGRWDLKMIEEAPIWKRLLVNYAYADHRRFWPERKAALQSILTEHPDSRWADDAALVLACGRGTLENDTAGAIADFERIVDRYADAQTVIDRWDPEIGCRFDETWLMWQGGLVSSDAKGRISATRPFDRDRKIEPLEREALTYFNHLSNYPRSTRATARLLLANLLLRRGDRTHAVAALGELVAAAGAYLPTLNRADRIAAKSQDGFLIRGLVSRPEYQAQLLLAQQYRHQGRMEKALEVASTLVESYSSDGWFWWANRQVADLYREEGRFDRASAQYSLALSGLDADEKLSLARAQRVGGSEIPAEFWPGERRKIEERRRQLDKDAKQKP